jgi:hypothetical protein
VFVEKASTFVSCCLAINNVERNVFVIPRETRVDATGQSTVRAPPPSLALSHCRSRATPAAWPICSPHGYQLRAAALFLSRWKKWSSRTCTMSLLPF